MAKYELKKRSKALIKFNKSEVAACLADALEKTINSMGYDLMCFDWINPNPDFFIEQIKIAA
jgi:hypothetical protein